MAQFSGAANGNPLARDNRRGDMSAADKRKLDGVLGGASRLATAALDGLLSAAHFSKLQTWPLARLAYTATGDVWSASAMVAGTSYDAMPAQNVVVNSTAAFLLFALRFNVLYNATAAGIAQVTVYINVDGTQYKITAPGGPNTLWSTAGGAPLLLSGFTAGTRQVKVQVKPNVNGNAYLRCASVPATEFLELHILELNP